MSNNDTNEHIEDNEESLLCIDCENATVATHECEEHGTLCDEHADEHIDDNCNVMELEDTEELEDETETDEDDEDEDELDDLE